MTTAADNASTLQTALEGLQGVTLAPAEIVTLLDVALLHPINVGGRIVGSYTINGRTMTIPLEAALKLRDYYRQRAIEDSATGDLVSGYVAFATPGGES